MLKQQLMQLYQKLIAIDVKLDIIIKGLSHVQQKKIGDPDKRTTVVEEGKAVRLRRC
jgi:hypothetical protein